MCPDDWMPCKVSITSASNLETLGIDEGVRSEVPRRGTQTAFNYTVCQ